MRAMLQRFMYGRYGHDQLNWFLLVSYLVFYLIGLVSRISLFAIAADVLIILALFRVLSRNVTRRRAENAKFMKTAAPAIRWFKLRSAIAKDKDHRYFKCPNCGQQLRVPKGKGKITINCRNCGVSFEKKT